MVDTSRSYEKSVNFCHKTRPHVSEPCDFPFKVQPINYAEGCRRFLLCELSELPKHSVGSKCELSLMKLGVEYVVNRAA